jgi:hypothetical protein
MAPSLKYVTVTNVSDERIVLYPRFLRPKKPGPPRSPIPLDPNQTSRPLPYHSLEGGKNWDSLAARGCIRLKEVPYIAVFGTIQNRTAQPISVNLELPRRAGVGPSQTRRISLKPLEISRSLHLRSILQWRKLKSLAKKRAVSIEPIPYIGPRVADLPSVGSYGDDDVYICWDCGGPIVFRYDPPRPIHI